MELLTLDLAPDTLPAGSRMPPGPIARDGYVCIAPVIGTVYVIVRLVEPSADNLDNIAQPL